MKTERERGAGGRRERGLGSADERMVKGREGERERRSTRACGNFGQRTRKMRAHAENEKIKSLLNSENTACHMRSRVVI